VRDSLGNETNAGLYYFVRFSADEVGRSYYEYRSPVPIPTVANPNGWSEVQLGLTELSNIKLDPRFPQFGDTLFAMPRAPGSADTLYVKGRPSFTRLRRISFGVINLRGQGSYNGQLWFDELRAIDVFKDNGHAERVTVDGRLSNLLTYNFAWNGRDADFLSVGDTRGNGTATNAFAVGANLDLHRFFEATGIVLPVGFQFSQNTARPRYSAGDDIVRGGADLIRSETFTDSRSWSAGYSRVWDDRANPLLRYTIGGITAGYNTSSLHSHNPSGAEQSSAQSGTVNWNIAPRSLLAMPLPIVRTKLYLLPERIYSNYRWDKRRSSVADRILGTDDLVPRGTVSGSSGIIVQGADTRPIDMLHHHIEAQRNLSLPYRPLGRLNIGMVTGWNQNVDASYNPWFVPWIHPQLSWSANFAQNNGPELSRDLTVRGITNGEQGSLRWTMPFGDLRMVKASPRDSGRVHGPGPIRQILSLLGNISGEVTAGRTSAYSRLTGIPDPLYLFGISTDPGLDDPNNPNDTYRMQASPGNITSKAGDVARHRADADQPAIEHVGGDVRGVPDAGE
jgi:hypothetical protein